LLHSVALVGSAGVSAKDFLPYVTDTVGSVAYYLEQTVRDVDEGAFPGDNANAAMMGATADHIVTATAATSRRPARTRGVRTGRRFGPNPRV
jgi:hypothetical protein